MIIILVLSRYVIDIRPYNTGKISAIWKSSSLCNWLNDNYFVNAFTSDEKKNILDNSMKKVFLLTVDDVFNYFQSDSERQAFLYDGTSVWWWLRYEYDNKEPAGVRVDGSVYGVGSYVGNEDGGVRPAMWIDISGVE